MTSYVCYNFSIFIVFYYFVIFMMKLSIIIQSHLVIKYLIILLKFKSINIMNSIGFYIYLSILLTVDFFKKHIHDFQGIKIHI